MTKIEQLKAAFEASTPGEWETSVLMTVAKTASEWIVCQEGGGDMIADCSNLPAEAANSQFIALAHNLMPVLLEGCARATQLEAAISIIADAAGDYTQNLVNDALTEVGYYTEEEPHDQD